ncbi:hypothetical protein PF011_g12762 [Phytophthora fragariae]|uniref:Ion transport domain-containing protein n=1 Tax=Phytophthora fragariae TaxID=53985 RepID=A0A6A3K800_9STRA|nr:hypothetical protein PF011_g12762 [Phytophthora fragariae]
MEDTARRNAVHALPPGAPTPRDKVMDEYRAHIKESRDYKKKQHKQVILEDVRKRPPRLHLRQETIRARPHPNTHNDPQSRKKEIKESPTRMMQGGNYLKKFLAGQFRLGQDERPEGWAAAKINRAMRRYYKMHLLLEKRDKQHLALQSKLLFDECCRCRPLVPGPITTESGVLRLAEPNLPKILRILRNVANDGLDLLQPHGVAQYTVMHVAAQRGYTDLVKELIMHWNEHPMNSPYQKYSFMQLSHLLEMVLEMRSAKRLVSESDAEMRALVADIGVSFARFSDSLDKLLEDAITLQDLLQICGHPLVLSKDAAGNTPLHHAAEGGHLTLCKLLLANGANINAQNKSGETPLHFAIASQRHGVCIHFVENHADVRISRYVSFTTLTAAVLAMDSFRNPLFRCSMLKHVRERNQRWTVSNQLKTFEEKRDALVVQMKGQVKVGRSPRRKRSRGPVLRVLDRLRKVLKKVWKFLRRVRSVLSVQHVFTVTENEAGHTERIVCEPKGILYEYVYDHAEFRGRHSPTLWMIVQTERKDLIFHPWFRQLLDHKWNSFTRQTFRSEFKVYAVYFVAVFIATYLRVGDTFVGMPLGGYRNNIFTEDVGYMEYIRDVARLVYSVINANYTLQEYQAYRECGSLRVYLRDGWNWFDLVQISCVWLLLVAEILELILPDFDQEDFRLIVYQESLYSFNIRRRYSFRITLMAIVGPQIFVKWIQFARGTRALGPFVRMIAKMFSDILVFVMVFCVFLGGFAFAFFILQLEGCKSYFSALTTTFNISLGSWDWDSIYEGGLLAILLFLSFVVIGTIMLLNLLIAMMGSTYDKVWEDRLLFFELERAKATLSIQMSLDDEVYDEKHWCPRLYVLEGDTPIEGIQFHRL